VLQLLCVGEGSAACLRAAPQRSTARPWLAAVMMLSYVEP
jgi:hypothetical protein